MKGNGHKGWQLLTLDQGCIHTHRKLEKSHFLSNGSSPPEKSIRVKKTITWFWVIKRDTGFFLQLQMLLLHFINFIKYWWSWPWPFESFICLSFERCVFERSHTRSAPETTTFTSFARGEALVKWVKWISEAPGFRSVLLAIQFGGFLSHRGTPNHPF